MSHLRDAIVALFLVVLSTFVGHSTATASPSVSDAVHQYAYNAPHYDGPANHASHARGPPVVLPTLVYDAVALGAVGTLVRSDVADFIAFDQPRTLVPGNNTAGATDGSEVDVAWELPTLPGFSVAAKSADEVADIGHAGIHQFPGTLPRKSQFFDDVDLGSLSARTKGIGGIVQPNGNTRYVLRSPGGAGVDRTTGLPTDVYAVIRRPDGSVVTLFPGTSPKG